jgi:hypothetical protein
VLSGRLDRLAAYRKDHPLRARRIFASDGKRKMPHDYRPTGWWSEADRPQRPEIDRTYPFTAGRYRTAPLLRHIILPKDPASEAVRSQSGAQVRFYS